MTFIFMHSEGIPYEAAALLLTGYQTNHGRNCAYVLNGDTDKEWNKKSSTDNRAFQTVQEQCFSWKLSFIFFKIIPF